MIGITYDCILKTFVSNNKCSNFNRRIQLLEVESKRSSNKKVIEADSNNTANTVESLSNEISEMRRQIVTAERIAKQSEVSIYLPILFILDESSISLPSI